MKILESYNNIIKQYRLFGNIQCDNNFYVLLTDYLDIVYFATSVKSTDLCFRYLLKIAYRPYLWFGEAGFLICFECADKSSNAIERFSRKQLCSLKEFFKDLDLDWEI